MYRLWPYTWINGFWNQPSGILKSHLVLSLFFSKIQVYRNLGFIKMCPFGLCQISGPIFSFQSLPTVWCFLPGKPTAAAPQKEILHPVREAAIPGKRLRVKIPLIIRILTEPCEKQRLEPTASRNQVSAPSGNITGKPRVTHLSYKQQHLQAKELLTKTQNDTKYKGFISAMLKGRKKKENRIL